MTIRSPQDIERLTLEYGFLPFFNGLLTGFSIEDLTPEDLWFSDITDGPWEWKGPVIAMGSVAYGKFFNNKAGFVSLEWLPDLMNYRREQFNLASHPAEREIYQTLVEHESLISTVLKQLCGYNPQRKPKVSHIEDAFNKCNKPAKRKESSSQPDLNLSNVKTQSKGMPTKSKASFDSCITRLQMATYIITADFEYSYNKQGDRYGWGKAIYTTPEMMYGSDISMPNRTPIESYNRMINHLLEKFPSVSEALIKRFIL